MTVAFGQDKEMPELYQPFFWGTFEGLGENNADLESFATTVPAVDVPKLQLDGNVALIDILPYLRRKEVESVPSSSDTGSQNSPSASLESSPKASSSNEDDKTALSEELASTPPFDGDVEGSADVTDVEPGLEVSGDRIVHTRTEHSKRTLYNCSQPSTSD